MNQDFDQLMRDFAQAQLGPFRGTLAENFQPAARPRSFRLWFKPLAIAAAFFLTAGMTLLEYPRNQAPAPSAVAVAQLPTNDSETVTEELWYRDEPGQTVLLEDNTPAQVVYCQAYEVRTRESADGKEVSTETIPVDFVALVSQPVF
jgi:hypothetical protein